MERIMIKNTVKAPAKKVWELWTNPEHIVKWNTASKDWHTTRAENDLRVGGAYMEVFFLRESYF